MSQKHLPRLKSSAIANQFGFIRNPRGTTTVEYALVLMMIAIGATLALNAFTLTTGGTLNILASSLPNDDNPRDAAAERIGSNLHPVTISPEPLSSAADARQIAAGRRHLLLQILVLSTALFAVVWAWIILRRERRRRQRTEESNESVEQIPSSQLQKSLEKRQQILRLLTNDVSRLFESRIRVRHLMSTDVMSVKPAAKQEHMLEVMAKKHIRHLLVCDEDRRLLGVVSNRDCRQKPECKARDLMASCPTTVSPNTTITIAVTLMMNKNISCLPVLENEELKGVLTTTDLLLSLQCSLQILMRVASNAELMEKVLGTLDAPPSSTSPSSTSPDTFDELEMMVQTEIGTDGCQQDRSENDPELMVTA